MFKTILPDLTWWKSRVHSLYGYLVIVVVGCLLFAGVLGIYRHFFPKHQDSTSSTTIKKIESGANVTFTTTNNNQPDLKQGLYVALTSDGATIGVFKQFTNNFRISLGAGEDYDGNAKAEVRSEISF